MYFVRICLNIFRTVFFFNYFLSHSFFFIALLCLYLSIIFNNISLLSNDSCVYLASSFWRVLRTVQRYTLSELQVIINLLFSVQEGCHNCYSSFIKFMSVYLQGIYRIAPCIVDIQVILYYVYSVFCILYSESIQGVGLCILVLKLR